jgi:hypothetical protein
MESFSARRVQKPRAGWFLAFITSGISQIRLHQPCADHLLSFALFFDNSTVRIFSQSCIYGARMQSKPRVIPLKQTSRSNHCRHAPLCKRWASIDDSNIACYRFQAENALIMSFYLFVCCILTGYSEVSSLRKVSILKF